jgi:hypothetical protein
VRQLRLLGIPGDGMTDRLLEIAEREKKAHRMIQSLCTPRGFEGHRDWIMSIPARLDDDPDLVIAASLGDIPYLLSLVKAQQEKIAELQKEIYDLQIGAPNPLT